MESKTRRQTTRKVVKATGKMSNLVGMYGLILDKNDRIKQFVFISGKAEDKIYIVQVVSLLIGAPNVAKLCHVSKIMKWILLPTREIADEVLEDMRKNKVLRYKLNF